MGSSTLRMLHKSVNKLPLGVNVCVCVYICLYITFVCKLTGKHQNYMHLLLQISPDLNR